MKTLLAALSTAATLLLTAAGVPAPAPSAAPVAVSEPSGPPVAEPEDMDFTPSLVNCGVVSGISVYAYETSCPAPALISKAIKHDELVLEKHYHKTVSFKGFKLIFAAKLIDCGGLCVGLTNYDLETSLISELGGTVQPPRAVIQHELMHYALHLLHTDENADTNHLDKVLWAETESVSDF